MIKENLNTIPKLQNALKIAEAYVSAHHKDTPYQNFENRSTLLFKLTLFISIIVDLYY